VNQSLPAALLVLAAGAAHAAEPERIVTGRTLVSLSAPAVRIQVPEAFQYAGGQRFVLYDVADAEQHLFVDADDSGLVRRLYWIQFEAYLPAKGGAYKYEGETTQLGSLAFVSSQAARSTTTPPRAGSDGARIRELLASKSRLLPPAVLWQRLVHLPDAGKRRELMIIYMEAAPSETAPLDGLLQRATSGLTLSWLLLEPAAPELSARAPDVFGVALETSNGRIELLVRREWSPHGVDRFFNLVRAGYYDGVRFHRTVKGRWTQFGVHGDPRVSKAWRAWTIPDDPRTLSNTRGTLAFAFAVPNGRTTQVFFNPVDNSATHDKEPFVPFAQVVDGLEVLDGLFSDYGEASGGGIRAGKQGPLFELGNAWLDREFPNLDRIVTATIVR
jgi:homoserine O-acetyltransferase